MYTSYRIIGGYPTFKNQMMTNRIDRHRKADIHGNPEKYKTSKTTTVILLQIALKKL